ncbi:PulJ/GspJ family protein [Synoicihabitans lomoniglobus]|uniref:Prepilin-type N-terminal cleavage/methylation domain-containing protein n=1 Tax=Synoicihabitans lomoniglobus TaxID=2909285 RepID=A0AAF0CNF5_9BACT|nr:prepilin-type N-terminal cleavage/methylation domain-containing protein [Opitutaceae bacterium LMO-M01]WED65448.1 prepilin-type N-terminal cleavage/methylation domain-containing protein [Opitutaceae bacterium LMO-M01]
MLKTKPKSRRGFSLAELMVAVTISAFVLAGVMSTYLYLGRGGVSLSQYNDMEAQARMTFQIFGQDCREATDADWTNTKTLELVVNGSTVTYTFNADGATFTRSVNGTTEVLADEITDFTFKAFDINTTELDVEAAPTVVGDAAKMIQVDLDLTRKANTNVDSTQRLISARFVLRNKRVS